MDSPQKKAINKIVEERIRQNAKWGKQNFDMAIWSQILMEEVGEFARADLKSRLEHGDPKNVEEELIQVAAVAVQILESIYEQKQRIHEAIQVLEDGSFERLAT